MGWQDDPLVDAPWEADEEITTGPQSKQPADAKGRAIAGLSGFNKGLATLAGLPVDTGENLLNLGITGTYAALNKLTGKADSPPVFQNSFGGSKSIEGLLNNLGAQTQNPNPEDMASRMLHTGGTIAGGSMVPGARVPSTLAAAAGGAAASEIDPRLTALGAIAPAAATAGAAKAVGAMRSGGNAAINLAMFKKAGTEPSAGMATGGTFFNGLENLLAKFPGSAGVMSRFRENTQKNLKSGVSTDVAAEDAGRAIEKGITGKGGFLETTLAQWKQLDNAVAAKVPKNTTVMPSETVKALDELTAPVRGAEKTTGSLANPKLVQMRQNIADDLAISNGRLPFEALRSMRTRIGAMQENSIVSGVQKGELKRLYGALSKDLEGAANAGGAGREFARQNAFYAARMGRIERTLERVLGKDRQPEDIFKAFYPKDPNQSGTAMETMRSLPASERKIVSQAVVDRLGRATPGKQNEYGDVFSSETFLTNYGKLSKKAKMVLFPDEKMRSNVEAVAAAASNIRHGSAAMSNPSGTAGSFAGYAVYFTPIAFLAGQGNMKMAAAAAATAGVAKMSAHLLTNPRFVGWLAGAPKTVDPKAHAAHMARLVTIYNSTDDEALKADLDQYIQSLNGEQ